MISRVLSAALLFVTLASAVQLSNILKVEICGNSTAMTCNNFCIDKKTRNMVSDVKYSMTEFNITSIEFTTSNMGNMLAYEFIVTNGTKVDTVVIPTCYSNGVQVSSVCGLSYSNGLAIKIAKADRFDGYYYWTDLLPLQSKPEIIDQYPAACVSEGPVLSYTVVENANRTANLMSYPVNGTDFCGGNATAIILNSTNSYRHNEAKHGMISGKNTAEIYHFQFQGPITCNLCGVETNCANLDVPAPTGVAPVPTTKSTRFTFRPTVDNSAVAFGNFSIVALLTVLLALF